MIQGTTFHWRGEGVGAGTVDHLSVLHNFYSTCVVTSIDSLGLLALYQQAQALVERGAPSQPSECCPDSFQLLSF